MSGLFAGPNPGSPQLVSFGSSTMTSARWCPGHGPVSDLLALAAVTAEHLTTAGIELTPDDLALLG